MKKTIEFQEWVERHEICHGDHKHADKRPQLWSPTAEKKKNIHKNIQTTQVKSVTNVNFVL